MDQEKIQRLQAIEENLHNYLGQKQQVQSQVMELESALASLGDGTTFQVIGNIMVERPKADVEGDVKERLERARVRLQAIEKQEQRLKEEAEKLQKDVMEHGNVQ